MKRMDSYAYLDFILEDNIETGRLIPKAVYNSLTADIIDREFNLYGNLWPWDALILSDQDKTELMERIIGKYAAGLV